MTSLVLSVTKSFLLATTALCFLASISSAALHDHCKGRRRYPEAYIKKSYPARLRLLHLSEKFNVRLCFCDAHLKTTFTAFCNTSLLESVIIHNYALK